MLLSLLFQLQFNLLDLFLYHLFVSMDLLFILELSKTQIPILLIVLVKQFEISLASF